MRSTRVVHTRERGKDTYAFSNVSATRDPKYGIQLTVHTSANHSSHTPFMIDTEAIHAADVMRAAVANAEGKSCGGSSIKELLEDELHDIIDRLMTGQQAEDGRDPGRAEGITYALAVFSNPYRPNVVSVKEQAMDRWYDENPDYEEEG